MTQLEADMIIAEDTGKVLIAALKENGGIGIIRDDSPAHIPEPVHRQKKVRRRDEEHVEIRIESAAAV